jgi:DNA invertase Pin-like site-specific DNA recombinase
MLQRTSTPDDFNLIVSVDMVRMRPKIRERTMAGLTVARSRGRVGGRPPIMTPDKIQVARQLYRARDLTVEEIAKTIGVSRKTVYRHLDALQSQSGN